MTMPHPDLPSRFGEIYREARARVTRWNGAAEHAARALGAGDAQAVRARAAHAVDVALESLRAVIERPSVVIATTGTTSGGKSTLVNFLCGARLMPAAVLEKSAGCVLIEHDPRKRAVTVEQTKGAVWDTGTFEETSADDIRARLEVVMDTYRALRAKGDAVEPPQFQIRWPTRIGADPERFGLPPGVRVQLLDLPGLRYLGDDANAAVIRDNVRQSLCLVTYNSEEVDPHKHKKLLDEVVSQVKELRGSPARMLFIINRIDSFRKDDGWPRTEDAFVEQLTHDIRHCVASALEEYAEIAAHLQTVRMSSEPALAAELLLSDSTDAQAWAFERIDHHYRGLIPDELNDELPRRAEKLSPALRAKLREAILQSSYGARFESALRDHLRDHLPALLVPPRLSILEAAIRDGSRELDEMLHARINASAARYEQEKARLERVSVEIDRIRTQLTGRLAPLRDLLADSDVLLHDEAKARGLLKRVAETHALPAGALIPFVAWHDSIGKALDEVLDEVRARLEVGEPLAESLAGLSPRTARKLQAVTDRLEELGYTGELAKRGSARHEARTPDERRRLRELNRTLNDLAHALEAALTEVIRATVAREADRMHSAMSSLLHAQVGQLQQQTAAVAPDLLSLQLVPPAVGELDTRLEWSPDLRAGFEIEHATRNEKVGERIQSYLAERSYRNLWGLLSREKTRHVPIYAPRPLDIARIPPLHGILAGFMDQLRDQRPEEAVLPWLRNALSSFDAKVQGFHKQQIDRYTSRLLEARKRAREIAAQDMKVLEGARRDLAGVATM